MIVILFIDCLRVKLFSVVCIDQPHICQAGKCSLHWQKYGSHFVCVCLCVSLCVHTLGWGGGAAAGWKQPIWGGVQGLEYIP